MKQRYGCGREPGRQDGEPASLRRDSRRVAASNIGAGHGGERGQQPDEMGAGQAAAQGQCRKRGRK